MAYDPFTTTTEGPTFDPFSLDFSMAAPSAPKTELVSVAVRETLRRTNRDKNTDRLKAYDEALSKYQWFTSPSKVDEVNATVSARTNAQESILGFKYGALPSHNVVQDVLFNEVVRKVTEGTRGAYTSIQLPDDNATKRAEAYQKVIDLAVASEMEKRNPGGWDMAVDLVVQFLPGYEQFKQKGLGALNPLSYAQDTELEKLYAEYNNLSMQDRVTYLDHYIKKLSDIAGTNDIAFANYAQYFFYEGLSGAKADLAIDAVDLATLGLGATYKIGRMGVRLKAAKNAIDAAAAAGDATTAGMIGARALVDDPAKFGLTPFQARAAADPWDWRKVDRWVPADSAGPINATIAAERKAQARILGTTLTDIPVRSQLTQAQLDQLQANKLADLEAELLNVPHKADVVESGVDGIRVRISTYDEMALEGIHREQAVERVRELESALADVERQLDEWDNMPFEVKNTDEAVAAHDGLLVTKRNILENTKKLEEQLKRTPETVEYRDIFYTKNDFGAFDGQIEMGWRQANLASPEKGFQHFDDTLVDNASVIEYTVDTLKGKLAKAFASVTKGLKKTDRTLVNELLMHGDNIKKEWTAAELELPIEIPGVGLVTLTRKQQAAYLKARDTFRWLWTIENLIQHRIVSFNNGRYAQGITFRGKGVDGVVYEKKSIPDKAKVIYTDALPSTRRGGNVVNLDDATKEKLQKLIKSGKAKVVEFENPLKVDDAHEVAHGVIMTSKLRGLPVDILPYRFGYVPLKRNVNYVLRENGVEIFSDGVLDRRSIVHAFFDTEADANRYMSELIRNDPNLAKKGRLTVHLDSQLRRDDQAYRQRVSKAAFSGLYSERRLGDDIPYGPEGGSPPRLSAFEAMNRYMGHIANVYPMNEWRLNVTEMYKKTARGLGALSDPNDWRSPLLATNALMPNQERGLRRLQSWLKDVLLVPDKQEMVLNALVRDLGRKLEKWSVADGARRWLMSSAEQDVAQLVKASSFHLLLGWFNPRQLFVQAAGAVIAAMHSPQHILQATRKGMFLVGINSLDPTDPRWTDTVRMAFAKAAMMDPDEAEAMADAWRRSGVGKSLRANVDVAAADSGLPIARQAISKVADKGLLFFRGGELTFRSYSWATAYQEFIKKFPQRIGKKLSQAEVDQITIESMKFTLNLLRANKAVWQKGWMGIPTQFWQVQAKFWENMMPWLFGAKSSDWAGHRWKIWAFHAAAFGTMGIPFGEGFREELIAWIKDPDGLGIEDETAAVAVYGGLVDVMFSHMLGMATNGEGVPFSISEAISIPEGALKMFDNFTSEDPVNARNMFGASWTVGNRAVDAITGPLARIAIPWKWNEVNGQTMLEAANDIGSLASSWRNVTKARLWVNNMAILSGMNTDEVALLDDETKYAAALGKALFGARSYYEIMNKDMVDILKDDAELYKEFMNAAKENLRMYSKEGLPPSGTDLEQYLYNMNILYNLFDTEEQRLRARKMWWNYIKESDSQLAKNTRNLQNLIKSHVDTHWGASYPQALPDDLTMKIEANPATQPAFIEEQAQEKRERKGY
jgi:hypothetical protein